MTLSIKDTMHFGKHKGMNVGKLLLEDPGYACWLREEKRKQDPRDTAFDNDANDMIDVAIESNRALKKKYVPWKMGEKAAAMKAAGDAVATALKDVPATKMAEEILAVPLLRPDSGLAALIDKLKADTAATLSTAKPVGMADVTFVKKGFTEADLKPEVAAEIAAKLKKKPVVVVDKEAAYAGDWGAW